MKLTEKEQADLDYKKRVYELAKKKTEAVDDAMEVRRQPWIRYQYHTHGTSFSRTQFILLKRPHGGFGDSIVFRRRTTRWETLQHRQSASRLHGNATGVWRAI